MEGMDPQRPHAREEGLVVQELPEELLVYDLKRHRVHRLNRTAALVWRHCDGRRSVAEVAALLQRELGIAAEEEVAWLAVERLGRAHLLRERLARPTAAARSTRRALVRKIALAGGLALVTSIAAPKAEAAVSGCHFDASILECVGPCPPTFACSHPAAQQCTCVAD